MAYTDLTTCNCPWIVCLLDILLIYDAHLVRQEVTLLKHSAGAFPFLRGKHISKIEPKHLLYSSSGAGNVLKANVGSLLQADLPSETIKRRDHILQRISDQMIG